MNYIEAQEALLGMGIGMIILMIIAIALLPTIFFLLTLHRTLEEVSPENRLMPAGQVWLTLIPLFGLIWMFIVVQRIADSLQKEFALRGIECKEVRPGYNVGLAYCILTVCGWFPFASLGAFICWIIYWVNIAGFKNDLVRTPLVSPEHRV